MTAEEAANEFIRQQWLDKYDIDPKALIDLIKSREQAAAEAATLKEREACAQVCDFYTHGYPRSDHVQVSDVVAGNLARMIRSRSGKTHEGEG